MIEWPRVIGLLLDGDDPDASMQRCCERIRMLLAEAGYPDARVYHEWTGIFVEGVPELVKERAFDLVNEAGREAISDGGESDG